MRFLLIGIVIAVIFWVVSIVDCAVQPESRHRGVGKRAWMLIVILIPVIGGVLWFTVGRPAKNAPRAPIAPDDNPAFLSTLGATYDQNERIRRIEEQLAQLDAEESAQKPKPKPTTDGTVDGDDSASTGGTTGTAG